MRFENAGLTAAVLALALSMAFTNLAHGQESSGTSLGGMISGAVIDATSGDPVSTASINLAGTRTTVLSNADGRFLMREVPAGDHTLQVMRMGYEAGTEAVQVRAGGTSDLEVRLSIAAMSIREIVVTPGRFGVMEENAAAPQAMGREMIETMPGLGEDIYRMVHRLPGVAADDYSAKFSVRGGGHDELLVRLDGLTLFEPFHLKDLDGALSIVDVQAVRGVDLTTGGFTADQGNRLTGVFDMRTLRDPGEGIQTSAGISLTNARIMSTGPVGDRPGNWLISARRGYLDLLMNWIDPEDPISPRYHDVIAKVEYQVSDRNIVSTNVLTAGDALTLSDGHFDLESRYGNHYAWLNWRAYPTGGLSVETVASVGMLDWSRQVEGGAAGTEITDLLLEDDRDFRFGGVQQAWEWGASDRNLFKWGGGVRRSSASYDYLRIQTGDVDYVGAPSAGVIRGEESPSAWEAGGHLTHRARLAESVTTELGVRFDHYSQSGESVVSPRFNAAAALGPRTTVRGAWGLYHQPQEVYQLQVQDGNNEFSRAERAEHRVVGIDHVLHSGIDVRVEVYQRALSRVRPRYHNLFNVNSGIEEAAPDRVRLEPTSGEARGIEVLASSGPRKQLRWSASYALSSVEDVIDGVRVPRGVDQRHAALLEMGYRASTRWSVAASWQVRSGRPYTQSTIESSTLPSGSIEHRYAFGEAFGERLAPYHRMDVRVTRRFSTGWGDADVFLDFFNLYGRENPRGWSSTFEVGDDGGVYLEEGPVMNLPMLPSFGVSWRF